MVKKKKMQDDTVEPQIDSTESVDNAQEKVDENLQTETSDEAIKEPENTVEKDLAELQDKHIRLHAEFDNFRRRTLKEKSDLIKSGGESTLVNLLPVIDDLERAMESIQSAQSVDAVKEGLDLIVAKFRAFLKQNGVQEIEAKEQAFDTDKHEAITKIPAPTDDLKGKVVDVVQKGYELHDKVIRFAKVVIGE